jgi:hypothetical protein
MIQIALLQQLNNAKVCKQQGSVLVVVLVFLAAMSVMSVSSITSTHLQLKLVHNQQTYQSGLIQISNVKQLILNQLSSDKYSERILQLPSVLDSHNQLADPHDKVCEQGAIEKLDINVNQHSEVIGSDKILSYLALLSIELVQPSQGNDVITISSERNEILLVQQCLQLQSSDIWLVDTSIIKRSGRETFAVTIINQDTKVRWLGEEK